MKIPPMCVVLLTGMVLLPASAHAEGAGLWEYLERLSGPGGFEGRSIKIPLACEFAGMAAERGTGESKKAYFLRCLRPKTLPADFGPVSAPPDGASWWKRRASVALYIGRFTTDRNDLAYLREPDDRGIVWWKLGPTFIWYASPYFDVHTSVEWNRLSSKGDAFDPFWVNSLEIVGITGKPFARLPAPWKWLSISVSPKTLTRSIRAEEFGAIPGAGPGGWRESGRETQLQTSLIFNIWEF